MLLVTLSSIFLKHPLTYETAKQDNLVCFIISKLKYMQLQVNKDTIQKSVSKNSNFIFKLVFTKKNK